MSEINEPDRQGPANATSPQVTVVYAFVDALPLADWRPDLPPAYSERLARMRSAGAHDRTLGGLWLLQQGASMAGLRAPALSTLERDDHDRPHLPDGPEFNISHSGDLVACALAHDCALGLDVERIKAVDTARLGRFLARDEHSAVEEDTEAFFNAWTAREAVVKATGQAGLARIARVQFTSTDQAVVDGETLYVQRLALARGYKASLATVAPGPAISIYNLRQK